MKNLSLSKTLLAVSILTSWLLLPVVVRCQGDAPEDEATMAGDAVFPLEDRPEGITEGPGSTLFVSQILSGKIMAVDVETGVTRDVVGTQDGREAWGLEYYTTSMFSDNEDDADGTNANGPEEGYLFVAGGGPSYGEGVPEVYVYSVATGEPVVSCAPLDVNETGHGAFINDVTIVNDIAYITDSFSQKLMVLDVASALDGNCTVTDILLPITFAPTSGDDWGANGVVAYHKGLLISNEIDGTVSYLANLEEVFDSSTIPVFQEVVGPGGAPGADGLAVMEDKLFVTQNTENVIGVFQLMFSDEDEGLLEATNLGNLSSPLFDTPATSAIYKEYIYSTNSRFVTLPDIGAPADDNIVRVRNTFYDESSTATSDTLTDGPSTEDDPSTSEPEGVPLGEEEGSTSHSTYFGADMLSWFIACAALAYLG